MVKNEYSLQGLIRLRDNKVHMSALMLLHIVSHIGIKGDGRAFIDEVEVYYREKRIANPSVLDYTRGGIASMLRVMEKRGYLVGHRDGHYKGYTCSALGNAMLDSIYS